MSQEDNKALVQRFVKEVLNQGNVESLETFFSKEPIEHQLLPGKAPGLEGIKESIRGIRAAFPDLHVEIEDVVAEGDKVATRSTLTGTHQGEFMGIAATGKNVSVTSIDITRVENGKQAEHWGLYDQMALMEQLGAMPMTGPPSGATPPEAFPS